MKFQILILTKPERHEFLAQLLSCLEPQIARLGLNKFDKVDILIRKDDWNDLSLVGVGSKRDLMRREATGDYIAWFDDDDLPATDYIRKILPLLDGIDYVGFNVETYVDKKYIGPTIHSLDCGGWRDEYSPPAHYRDISHLNPMRRDLAMQVPFGGPIGEDHRWADSMRGLVKTQHYADKVLYYYFSRSQKNDAVDAHDLWRLDWLERLRP